MIKSNIQKAYVQKLLTKNLRPDGRNPFQMRDFSVNFLRQRGSLVFNQGETSILVKITNEILTPKQFQPSQGAINFRVDCSAAKSTPQENKKLSAEIIKLLQHLIIGCNALDPQSLCIVTGKSVWELKIQAIVINDDGNIIDSVLNAVIVSLMDMRLPMLKTTFKSDQTPFLDKYQQLSIAHLPLCRTFGLIKNNMVVDPSKLQDYVLESRVTIGVNVYQEICLIHKIGGMDIETQILNGAIAVCQKWIKRFTEQVRKVIEIQQYYDKYYTFYKIDVIQSIINQFFNFSLSILIFYILSFNFEGFDECQSKIKFLYRRYFGDKLYTFYLQLFILLEGILQLCSLKPQFQLLQPSIFLLASLQQTFFCFYRRDSLQTSWLFCEIKFIKFICVLVLFNYLQYQILDFARDYCLDYCKEVIQFLRFWIFYYFSFSISLILFQVEHFQEQFFLNSFIIILQFYSF